MKLANDINLPLSAVTQTFAFLGKRGGGKTYGATKLCELMLEVNAQIIAIDPVGVWYGLRVPRENNQTAFNLVVFGGSHGDIEINPKAGKIIAEIVIKENISAVVDISLFIQSEQTRFVYDFLTTVFELKKLSKSPTHIFIEEAQEIVPQNIIKGDSFAARILNAGERLVKLGRNFGIGCSLISQRPQEVNKKVLNQTEVMLAFQMTGIQERKTIAEWTQDKGSREEMVGNLPTLEIGEALVWSPSWLKFDGKVKILPKVTADVSATPELGAVTSSVTKLNPIDVEKLKKAIALTEEKAETENPKTLKQQIFELKKQIQIKDRTIEDLRLDVENEYRARVELKLEKSNSEAVFPVKEFKNVQDYFTEMQNCANEFKQSISKFCDNFEHRLAWLNDEIAALKLALPTSNPVEKRLIKNLKPNSQKLKIQPIAKSDLPKPQQKILDALALCEKLGLENPRRINVAFFAGYTENGHFNNTVGLLNASQMLFYPVGGCLALTDKGRELANADNNPIQDLQDLHEFWLSKLSNPQQRVLQVLLNHYPNALTRKDLAEFSGYTVNGHFNNTVGSLVTLGIAEYPNKGMVAATKVIFPDVL